MKSFHPAKGMKDKDRKETKVKAKVRAPVEPKEEPPEGEEGETTQWELKEETREEIGVRVGAGAKVATAVRAAAEEREKEEEKDREAGEGKEERIEPKEEQQDEVLACLKKHWGYSEFRPLQQEIIETCLAGKDAFVVMATGSGKSICYQIPPLVLGKPMVVISPLISLMEDQCMALQERGIDACALTSAETNYEVTRAAVRGEYSVIYMSPERLEAWMDNMGELMKKKGISGFAIDECHCISEWGHEFRPAYLFLHRLRESFPSVPILALTATATAEVQAHILSTLKLRKPSIFRTSFDRPNLFYSVKPKKSLADDLPAAIVEKGPCIIYCMTKKDCEHIAEHLIGLGVRAAAYHAALSAKVKTSVHRDFMHDDLQCIVATIAYGMGIDKPDIRTILHYGLPKSVESYYQQTGRAGRDGAPAFCTLFYSRRDFGMGKFFAKDTKTESQAAQAQQRFAAMRSFVTSDSCRRVTLLAYFGEKWKGHGPCLSCDNCTRPIEEEAAKRDFTDEAKIIAMAVVDLGERYGVSTVIDFVRGAKTKRFQSKSVKAATSRAFGKLKRSEKYLKALTQMLLNASVLENCIRSKYTLCALGVSGRKLLHDPSARLPPLRPSHEMAEELAKSGNKGSSKGTPPVPPKYTTGTTGRAGGPRSLMEPLKASTSFWASTERAIAARKTPTLTLYEGEKTGGETRAPKPTSAMSMTPKEKDLYRLLMDLRKIETSMRGVPPYQLCGPKALELLTTIRPTTLEGFAKIDGISKPTVEHYGRRFVEVISSYCKHHHLRVNAFPSATTPSTSSPSSSSSPSSASSSPAHTTSGADVLKLDLREDKNVAHGVKEEDQQWVKEDECAEVEEIVPPFPLLSGGWNEEEEENERRKSRARLTRDQRRKVHESTRPPEEDKKNPSTPVVQKRKADPLFREYKASVSAEEDKDERKIETLLPVSLRQEDDGKTRRNPLPSGRKVVVNGDRPVAKLADRWDALFKEDQRDEGHSTRRFKRRTLEIYSDTLLPLPSGWEEGEEPHILVERPPCMDQFKKDPLLRQLVKRQKTSHTLEKHGGRNGEEDEDGWIICS